MRNVTVYSTSGKTNVKIETGATTFGELTPQLREHGFNLDGMKAVVGETKVTLEADGAVLPDGEFKLFLMPLKTKSGADMTRPDAYAKIQGFIERDGDRAKNHFNGSDNYTRTKTVDLINLIESYEGSSRTSSAPATSTATSAPVTQTVTLVEKEEFEALLEKLLDIDGSDLVSSEEDNLNEAIAQVEEFINRFEEIEREQLANEANDLMSEFNDVRR